MLERKKIELEFVTPAFLSGADQKVAEWREPSIRGQLRWWFRAIAGGNLDLDGTRTAEAKVFGTTDHASPLRLRVLRPGPESVAPGERCLFGSSLGEREIAKLWESPGQQTETRLRVAPTRPIHYLGYGPILWNRARGAVLFERAYFKAGGPPVAFHLQIHDSDLDLAEFAIFKRALWAWLNLGGIGARSRRGFGSVGATETEGLVPIATNVEALEEGLKSVLSLPARVVTPLPEWSHFSPLTSVYISEKKDSWVTALQYAGAWMIGFRRRYGAPFDERALKQNRDYEWFAPKGKETHGQPSHGTAGHVPDRAGFGLPLPFGQHDVLSWTDGDETEGRRASSLLLRISRFGQDYYSVWTHIPARFIPKGGELHCESIGTKWAPTQDQDDIVGEFLTDLSAKKLVREVGR